jgi:hypothetical protein
MPDERTARPVFGEIMTRSGRTVAVEAVRGTGGFTDAEFTVRPGAGAGRIDAPPAGAAGFSTLRKDGPGQGRARRDGSLTWLLGISIAAAAFWASGGHALVLPARTEVTTASGGSGTAFRLARIASRVEVREGRAILFVDGSALNEGGVSAIVPPIAIGVKGGDGATVTYHVGAGADRLPPGGQLDFSARLEAPEKGVRTVSVAFTE